MTSGHDETLYEVKSEYYFSVFIEYNARSTGEQRRVALVQLLGLYNLPERWWGQLLAPFDLNGDGRNEIAVRLVLNGIDEFIFYEFDGERVTAALDGDPPFTTSQALARAGRNAAKPSP